jgi:hypothetical protein
MMEFDLLGFAAHLSKLPAVMLAEQHHAMEKAANLVEKEAKDEIGEYQQAAGPFAAWDPLAPSTLADKGAKGYAPPDNPLLRAGDLRDSIEHTVSALLAQSSEADVGSNSDVAVWQELGTTKMPARSFLGGALVRKEAEVVTLLGQSVYRVLIGEGTTTHIP